MIQENLKLSILIPAYNESHVISETVEEVSGAIGGLGIAYEILVVNDASTDDTLNVLGHLQMSFPNLRVHSRAEPRGFGRAIRDGLRNCRGEFVIIVMADMSDDPLDIIKMYRKMADEHYDAVFGTRFDGKAVVKDYPPLKFIVNRIVNKLLQLLFFTRHNDLTNAFKGYRGEVIQVILPTLKACHFNITIELSLSVLIRNFRIAVISTNWYGNKWRGSNLKLREMGRRYFLTMASLWLEKNLILDDILEEKDQRCCRRGTEKGHETEIGRREDVF